MHTIQTKFKIGDTVFCMDKRGDARERKITGLCASQLFNRPRFTTYSFIKDNFINTDFTGEMPDEYGKDDFFWMKEDKLFATREELIESLK